MSRYFGQSEENVRELFKDAEAEYQKARTFINAERGHVEPAYNYL